MKRFVLIFLAVAAILVVADRVVGYALQRDYDHINTNEIGRLNRISHEVSADVMVFGSSRALHHYVPQVMTEVTGLTCYNCGFGGESNVFHYALMRQVQQRHTPRLFIYEFTVDYDAEAGREFTTSLTKIRRMTSLACRDSILTDVSPRERWRMLSRIYPYNSALFEMLTTHIDDIYAAPDVDQGYVPLHHTLTDTTSTFHLTRHDYDPLKVRYMERMMNEFGDRLVIVVSPHFRTQADVWSFHEPMAQLAASHGVPFIYMMEDKRFADNPLLWDDDGHLNDRGARMFTKILADTLQSQGILKQSNH